MKYSAMALPTSRAMQNAFIALSESSDTSVNDITIRAICSPVRTTRSSTPRHDATWRVEPAKAYSGQPNSNRLARVNAARNVGYLQLKPGPGRDRIVSPEARVVNRTTAVLRRRG